MERKDYIECIRTKTTVMYKGIEYLPIGYELSLHNNTWSHLAKMQNPKCDKHLMYGKLDEVKFKEK